ncbi:mucin-13b [Dunckerocampus dactyliophorus]|uniref:mucin-13b n=1 Tax=Dunckerocampus dactyliophorus TaxID=161453 RepID=UPI0024064116|nr:mucin-13b [Dunckerocampus dactyliophorus]
MMAREFKLLFVVCLVAACNIELSMLESNLEPTNEAPPTTPTVAPAPSTQPPEPTTVAPAPSTQPPEPTTVAPAPSTQPPEPTTVAPAPSTQPPEPTTVAPATQTQPTEPTTVAPATPTQPTEPTTVAPATPTQPTEPTTVAPATLTQPTEPTTVAPATPTQPTEPTTLSPSIQPTSSDSVAPSSNSPTVVPATTELPDICDSHPCGDGITCEARINRTFVCLCMTGEFFNGRTCQTAKVFNGQLQVPNIRYEEKMKIKTSEEFADASQQINEQIHNSFQDVFGFSHSIVLELNLIGNKRADFDGVNATLEFFFYTSSPITTQTFDDILVNASKCDGCILANSTFTETDLCLKNPCEEETAVCSAREGFFECSCKPSYIKTDYSKRACVACPSGQKPNGTWDCMDCPYGHSGFNCSETWQLALVIVGSVFGGLLLISLTAVIVMACKSPKKSSKKNKRLDTEENHDMSLSSDDKHPLVNSLPANRQPLPVKTESDTGLKPFPSGGVPRIPRATASSAWDSGTNLEMSPSNGRHNFMSSGRSSWLDDNSDDMNGSPYQRPRNQTNPHPQTRPTSNPYSDSRPLNNPYTQDGPQRNPYARNPGQSNPNYSHDDGRPFNY